MKSRAFCRGCTAFALFALNLGLGVDGRAAVLDAIPWVLDSTTGSSSYAQTGNVIVTTDGTEEDGAMWDPCTINLTQSFNMTFTINFGGNVYGCGADGMAFVLQTQGTGVVGAASAEHGYDSGGINGASLAVIMDTWTNPTGPYDDPGDQSLGIEDNDSVSDVACNETGPVTINGPCRPSIIADGSQATDANDHQVNFSWVPSGSNATMTVSVDGTQRAVWTVDNYATIFNADGGNVDDVTFGITGGTGGGYNVQQAGLDNGSTADGGTEVSNLCGDATFTPNAIATETITPGNVCSVTQPPTFTVSETPTISATFTVSPTPSPTFTPLPTDCGTPTYVGGEDLLQGQPGDSGGSTTTDFTYDVPGAVPILDALVMVVVQEPAAGTNQQVVSMTFGGATLTPGPNVTNVTGGNETLFYLPVGELAEGDSTLAVTYNNTDNASQNITIYVIGNVSQSNPIGQTAGPTDISGNGTFTAGITPKGSYSMVMDFLVGNNGCMKTGLTSSQTNPDLWGGNGSGTYTGIDYTIAGAAGVPDTLHYDWTASCGGELSWWLVEVEGPDCATSPTDSPTVSPTATSSDSPTQTFTDSPSRTVTDSPTPTDTPTQTFTDSPTSTTTDSPTGTDTPSSTDTATLSSTPTDTPSETDTPSSTDTATQSPTATDTPTASFSPTDTLTFTQSDTVTDSPTSTDSPTPTFTSTPSFTSTSTLTYTLSQTFSSTSTSTETPSATPSFTQSSTFTATDTSSASPTPSDTFTVTDTPSITPTFTDSSTFTDSPTITNTPVPVPVDVTISVYNSAGELVKILYQGGVESLPKLSVSGSLVLAGTQPVFLNLGTTLSDGQSSVSWNGVSNNGQLVMSGVYYFQVVTVNNFGNTTSYDQPVQVLGQGDNAQPLSIYNSAGELVWSGPLPSGAIPTASLSIGSPVMIPTLKDLSIQVGTSTETWNGVNLQGAVVQPGTYLLQLSGVQPGGAVLVQTKQFVVLASTEGLPSANATIVPNPWHNGQPLQIIYTPAGGGIYGAVILYDLLGRRLGSASDPSGSGSITVPMTTQYPSGIYLLDFRQMSDTNILVHKVLKFAIIQ